MKKIILVYIVLIIAVILLAVVRGGGDLLSFIPLGKKSSAVVNGKTLNLTVARSTKDLQKGLSGKKSLAQDAGMLFVFDKKDTYGFWMKGMLFPLDIVYIDDNTVVYVVRNAPPPGQAPVYPVYKPDVPANYVLEINAGSADKLKIQKGTKITFKNI